MAFLDKSSFVINILGIGMDWKQMTHGTVWGVDVYAKIEKHRSLCIFISSLLMIF
jgi:hypothetical protein